MIATITDSTLLALESAVRAAPKDLVRWYAIADCLAEQGDSARAESLQIFGEWATCDYSNWNGSPSETKQRALTAGLTILCHTPVEIIRYQLDRANGRRRVRTLSLADVAATVIECVGHVYAAKGGGSVANAYGYPSTQTVCLAVQRGDGKARVGISTNSGSNGASLVTPFGMTARSRDSLFAAWAHEDSQ